MTSIARDINTVCTHADLIDELGSARALSRIAPLAEDVADPSDPTKRIREAVYRDILVLLKNRVPPIREADIGDPAQLRELVIYGTLARLYFNAITAEDDVHHVKFKHWNGMYQEALLNLKVEVGDGYEVSTAAIEIERG